MARTKKKRKPKINSKYNSDYEDSSSEELPLVPPPNPKNKPESIRNPVNPVKTIITYLVCILPFIQEIHQLMGYTVEKEIAIITENSQLLNYDVDIQKKKVAPVKFARDPGPEAETNSEVMVLSPSTSSETFLCNGCKKTKDLLPKLMEKLEMIADDVKYLLLCQAVNKGDYSLSKPFMSCKTKEELVKLEESLDDEGVFQSTCVVFQAVGGKDIIDTTRRILSKLLSAELANQYNWTGRNSKQQFSKFHNILKILLAAVRRNPLSRNATAKDIEQVTKHYLRNSFDRGLNRGIRSENLDI
ncbi:uncharacterized protein LOC115883523 [Sitophilus oryzae]|uniref:Uncharacterized protein LOC115883523 n=1 Tax=Sitophilus oryzae TaxID=7048 RepID=A0A6J2Y1T6_SITOR|nr:uncharacterized protein LOC115883523 [Sitophilus oryzae]